MISHQALTRSLSHLQHKISLQLLPLVLSFVLSLALFAMLAVFPALAQNCSTIRSTITCDDGLSGQRTGNQIMCN